ncbi:hypothetical protein ACN27F_00090 [Solwaraspora sp. WMMB335]|uniref:hypothetical protein n=1 Tax=Solwaraspora sp. WMMB335 TaxID=3404118 RepID=UPI003B951198
MQHVHRHSTWWLTDYDRWLEPGGTLHGVFLFVDFTGAAGTGTDRDDVEDDFATALPAWFDAASYGQVTVDLDFTTSWLQMPDDHDEYGWPTPTFEQHHKYMQDAVDLWDPTVDFSQYDPLYVVSPPGATGIGRSPAFIADESFGVTAENSQVEFCDTGRRWAPTVDSGDTRSSPSQWQSVTAEGVFVQITAVSGANREVYVSW